MLIHISVIPRSTFIYILTPLKQRCVTVNGSLPLQWARKLWWQVVTACLCANLFPAVAIRQLQPINDSVNTSLKDHIRKKHVLVVVWNLLLASSCKIKKAPALKLAKYVSVARKKILKIGGHSCRTCCITHDLGATEDALGGKTSTSMKLSWKMIQKSQTNHEENGKITWADLSHFCYPFKVGTGVRYVLTNLCLNKSKETLWIKIVSDMSLLV